MVPVKSLLNSPFAECTSALTPAPATFSFELELETVTVISCLSPRVIKPLAMSVVTDSCLVVVTDGIGNKKGLDGVDGVIFLVVVVLVIPGCFGTNWEVGLDTAAAVVVDVVCFWNGPLIIVALLVVEFVLLLLAVGVTVGAVPVVLATPVTFTL